MDDLPIHLVLPREDLAAWLAGTASAPLASARLAASHVHDAHWVTPLGRLQAGAPRRLALAPGTPADHGTLVLHAAASSATPPGNPQEWARWLAQWAPGFRLASEATSPALAALWLRDDGLAAAAWREPGLAQPWLPVARLMLPGAGMLNLPLHTPMLVPPRQAPDDNDGRYSRQAGALGADVLARMQAGRFAIIGLGRTGSAMAHSLARMGCSLLCLDPDVMDGHSLDADLPPLHEGRTKVEAVAWSLRGLLRPGAMLQARALPVASPVAGRLIAAADIVICCVDNDAARLWGNAWALALHKPLLDVATGVHEHGAEADLRLLLPGMGCLACVGGFSQTADLLTQLQHVQPPATPADFRTQRRGSLRSWAQISANLGLRMVEQLYTGRLQHSLFRRLVERAGGGLAVDDASAGQPADESCPLCGSLAGAGLTAVTPARLLGVARRVTIARTS